MVENTLISIIMPAYNAEKFISKSIKSVLRQTYNNFELIIANDGSTDNTESVIKKFDDSRIIYIKNDKNLGIIKTLNKCIEISKGAYIARLDSDDIALPNWLEVILSFYAKNSSWAAIATSTYWLDQEEKYYTKPHNYYEYKALPAILLFDNVISHPGIVFNSTIIKKLKYLDNSLVLHFEDQDCWNRIIALNQKILIIKDRLILYRLTGSGISMTHRDDKKERLMQCRQIWIEQLNHKEFDLNLIVELENNYSIINIKKLYLEFEKFISYYDFDKRTKHSFYIWETLFILNIAEKSIYNILKLVLCSITGMKLKVSVLIKKFLSKNCYSTEHLLSFLNR